MKKTILLTIFIIFVLITRFLYLGRNPIILNRDEAALAYNAQLLEQTGRDEWGKTWPLTLQSFGDYKLIGYPTFLVFFFKILGANDFVVRLPSALAGLGSLYCIYLLAKRFIKNKNVVLTTVVLASLTPIFFFYSHIAFEANLALFFFLSFILLLIRPVDKKTPLFDLLALVVLVTALLTYNTPFILLPFMLVLIPFIRGYKNWKSWFFLTTGSVVVFLIFYQIFSALTAQKQAITIFADPAVQLGFSEYRTQFSGISQTLIGNKYLYYLLIITSNFIASLSPSFLVTQGGTHPWHSLPNWSHLLITQYMLIFVGIFFGVKKVFTKQLFSKKFYKNTVFSSEIGNNLVLLYLLVISLVPAVITTDAPHATRSLFFIVVLLLWIGKGLEGLITVFKNEEKILTGVLASTLILFSIYFYRFAALYPEQQSEILLTGFDKTIAEVKANYSGQPTAIVDPGGYQYILAAWYLKMAPDEFFNTVVKQAPNQAGLRYGERLGDYHFIAAPEDRSQDEKISVEWNDGWYIKTH